MMQVKSLRSLPSLLQNLSLKNIGLFKTVFSNQTLIDLRMIAFLRLIWMLNNKNES